MGLFGFLKDCGAAFAEGWNGDSSPGGNGGNGGNDYFDTDDWSLEDTLNFEPYHNEQINYPISCMHEQKEFEKIVRMNFTELSEYLQDFTLEIGIRPEDVDTDMYKIRARTISVMTRERVKRGEKIHVVVGEKPGALDYLEAAGRGIIEGQVLVDAITKQGMFGRESTASKNARGIW
tara:strand:- start:2740 stop:3270 length:531 start_codon:yes stop_codon:yes gene_type:complete